MTIFDEISFTVSKIKKIQDKIVFLEMQADTPRSSVFSDMPKSGGGAGNPLEQYMIKKEKQIEKLKPLKKRLNRQWARAVYQMDSTKIDKQTQKMMYLRYYCDLPWKQCAKELDKEFPNCKWNANKCFRRLREVLYRIRQYNRENAS